MVRFVCVAVLIAGSLTAASAATWAEDDVAVQTCFKGMDSDPALAVVNAKFARRDPTAAQLADESVPREKEAEQLRERVRKTAPCRELRLAAVKTHRPALEPAYTTLYYQADQVFDYLQQRVITYGTANRLSAEALELFTAREKAYDAASPEERIALAEVWSEQLQQAHSNPPPDRVRVCSWDELNIACD